MRISDWSSDVCSSDLAEQRLKPGQSGPGRALRSLQSVGERFWDGYKKSLSWALRHSRFMMLLLAITIGLNFYLYTVVQKGFFPQQDTGQLLGFFRVDQGTSFTSMVPKLEHFEKAIRTDPAVQTVTGFARARGGRNVSFMQIKLRPFADRPATAPD